MIRAKIGLAVIFLMLRALDVFLYTHLFNIGKPALLAALINNAVWTTVLLGAVWIRKNWARYVLIAFLFLGLAVIFALLPDFSMKSNGDNRTFMILVGCAAVDLGISVFLLCSSDLERYTGRSSK